MEGTAATGCEGTDSPRGFSIEWIQDRHRRLVRISGVIDAWRLGHIATAMIDLGQRRLTIDLSGASVLADHELQVCLEDLQVRLGSRLERIVPPGPFDPADDG